MEKFKYGNKVYVKATLQAGVISGRLKKVNLYQVSFLIGKDGEIKRRYAEDSLYSEEEYNKREYNNCKKHGEPGCNPKVEKYNWPKTKECQKPPEPTEEEKKELKKICLECCHFDPIE